MGGASSVASSVEFPSFLPTTRRSVRKRLREDRPEVPIDLRVALDDPGKIRFCHDEDVQVGGRPDRGHRGLPVRSEISPTEPRERRCRRDARFRPSRR